MVARPSVGLVMLPLRSKTSVPLSRNVLTPVDRLVVFGGGEPAIGGAGAGLILHDSGDADVERLAERVEDDEVGGRAFAVGVLRGFEVERDGRGVAAGGRHAERSQAGAQLVFDAAMLEVKTSSPPALSVLPAPSAERGVDAVGLLHEIAEVVDGGRRRDGELFGGEGPSALGAGKRQGSRHERLEVFVAAADDHVGKQRGGGWLWRRANRCSGFPAMSASDVSSM